ncbi:class I SAM-dependent methyltransferase [Candidatus Vondammii sp. HM_W22]|uniref:class I SAM-dependent methyltransferase n=1 Tax=Candidatus Vondammii sp. HM_W22 TaxID=2687299 RepID=UPI001F12B785|nr:class I SAM-dependent methyltransferase [Candidatus Vondammii sp. HM_W22]
MTINRQQHWENVYRAKQEGETSWFQPSPDLSLKLIEATGINHGDAIIDVGSGTSRLVDCLLTNGYNNISLLDISSTAIQATKKRLGEASDSINWLISDVTEFSLDHPIKLWHDRAVFHFLTNEDDRIAYIHQLKQYLPAEGHLMIAAFSPEGPKQCSGLDIVQYDTHRIQQTLGQEFKLRESVCEIHLTPAGGEQHFNYFRFLRIN